MLFGDGVWPSFQWRSGRGVRRSVLHDKLAAAGARFGQSSGWEYPLWFGDPEQEPTGVEESWGRGASFPYAAEEHARRPRGGRRDGHVADVEVQVQGPDAGAVLNRLSISDRWTSQPGRSSTPSGATSTAACSRT